MADEITEELQQFLHNIPGSQSNTFPPLDAPVSLNNDEDTQSSYDSDTTTSVDEEGDEVVNDDGRLPLSMGLSRSMIQDFGAVISSNGRAQIAVKEVSDHATMPDYPETARHGILHFIHSRNPIEATDETSIRKAFIKQASNIQFGLRQQGGYTINRLKILSKNDDNNAGMAYHQTFICSGIKYCEYAHPLMFHLCEAYDRVKPENINNLRIMIMKSQNQISVEEQLKKDTQSFFYAFMKNFQKHDAPCVKPTGERSCHGLWPKITKRHNTYFLGCPYNSDAEPWHTAQAVSEFSSNINLKDLFRILDHGIDPGQHECPYVAHPNSRRKYCEMDHKEGPGQLNHAKCLARFDLFIPVNWDRFPFQILVTRGRHAHHPPHPTKLPLQTIEEVTDLIKSKDLLGLTARQLIISPQFKQLISRYGSRLSQGLHLSLHIEDKLAALIRKQKLLSYPLGSALAAVQREYMFDHLKDSDQQWIREIHHFDDEHFLILCCTYAQAKAFTQVQCIEMDLAYKMVAGKTNVFSIGAWNKNTKRINVYCYALLNWDTRGVYAIMFSKLFDMLGKVARSPIQFAHIHGSGIRTVTVDMCRKQAPGFGDFLHGIDGSRVWQEHLQHILVFCKTHVQRNFMKKFPCHPAKHEIHQLWEKKSKSEILEYMHSMYTVYPELKHWLKHKQKSWVLAGLTLEQSKVDYHWWIHARDHTGISESSHFQDNNFTGRRLSLLNAVLKLKDRSEEIFKHNTVFSEQGVNTTWRNSSNTTRLAANMRRKEQRNRQAAERRQLKPHLPFNPRNPYDTPTLGNQQAVPQDDTSSIGDVDTQSMTSIYETPAPHMSRASSTSMPPPSRRRRRQTSETNVDAHAEHMRNLRRRVEQLEQQKEEAELLKRERQLQQELNELQKPLGS